MTDNPDSVKVMVVDDQQLMRDGISSLLSIQDGIDVVGTAGDGQEAIEQAISLKPDVILMDVRMPVMNGIAATEQIRQQLPDCQVLMLTTFDDEEYIVKALVAGASGYLLKDIPAQDLAHAVQLAHKPDRLKALRNRLHDNRQHKQLFNALSFVHDLEAALEKIWRQYCNKQMVCEAV